MHDILTSLPDALQTQFRIDCLLVAWWYGAVVDHVAMVHVKL